MNWCHRVAWWLAAGLCLGGSALGRADWRGALPPRFEPAEKHGSGTAFLGYFRDFVAEFRPREVRLRFTDGRSVRMIWEGARAGVLVMGEQPLPSRTNYFLGNRREHWRTGVPHYRGVRYHGLYRGINARFYASGQALEYDLELAPGADLKLARLRIEGADSLRLTPEGHLEILVGQHRLIQKQPVAWQDIGSIRRVVDCRYRLADRRRIALIARGYDPQRALVVDPVLVYATYFGTATNDNIIGVRADANGMVYIAGYTSSGDLTSTSDSIQTANAGKRDIFVAKLDPRKEGPEALIYFTYLGGSEADTPTAFEVDAQGNVYLTGWTQSTDFPLGGNAPQIQRAGDTGQDAFVVKLNPAIPGPLGLVFSTYLGGTGSDTGYAIATDSNGFIYVAGVTKSEDFPVTEKVLQRGRWGDQDGFIVWLDPNAPDPPSAIRYASYLGGEYNDEARAVVALGPGVVAVAGETTSELFHVTGNAFRPTYQGGGDIFVTVLDMKIPEYDALLYSTYLGGSGSEAPRRMVADAAGRLVLTGYTLSGDFPVTPNAYQLAQNRSGQAFVAILDPRQPSQAGLIYSTYFGASGGEVAYGLALDAEGRIYLTGYTLSRDFPVTPNAFQKDFGEGVEAFCAVLDPRQQGPGALRYATYLGRAGINVGYGIAVAPDGTIYVAGSVQDRAFPVTESALQATHAGGLADGFLIALKPGETGLADSTQTISMQSP
jgi:hypothetical protein